MHAGQIVENASVEALVRAPRHPYAAQLLASTPQHAQTADDLQTVPGNLPDLIGSIPLCRFSKRCTRYTPDCDLTTPPLLEVAPKHFVACRHPLC
jgi:oligopeptide/dipeptide ABC transporter ATP-binding protein